MTGHLKLLIKSSSHTCRDLPSFGNNEKIKYFGPSNNGPSIRSQPVRQVRN